MRVYLPLTFPRLHQAWEARSLHSPGPANAVTPGLRDSAGDLDEEELEYLALKASAAASTGLLQASGEPLRRVVIAADVEDAAVRSSLPEGTSALRDVTSVWVDGEITVASWASVHVDEGVIVDRGESPPDLQWYATQEVPDLLRSTAGGV